MAVAVIVWPTATLLVGEKPKETLPKPSVVTFFDPISFLPSFVPEGLEKNWIL